MNSAHSFTEGSDCHLEKSDDSNQEPQGIPYSVGEARKEAEGKHLDQCQLPHV